MAPPMDAYEKRDRLREQAAHYRVSPRLVGEGAPDQSDVIIELHIDYPDGLENARAAALKLLADAGVDSDRLQRASVITSKYNLFLRMDRDELRGISRRSDSPSPIYKVWPDEELQPFVGRSLRTVKADACLTSFGADGANVIVAVADSGIDSSHRHFKKYDNLKLPQGLNHKDFTGVATDDSQALSDRFGHGTHVAGIIAGHVDIEANNFVRLFEVREEGNRPETRVETNAVDPVTMHGVAPKAKLLSLKVLDDAGRGKASSLIAALEYLYELNDSGRKVKVHCVNLSVGYPFEAEWYAAGQSPLCIVVNRLARSGVVVVAAAGNDGSILLQPEGSASFKRMGSDQTINDPGNAEGAITVGSTHFEAPHQYGVSYFSSRGPTADGREKPDLLAPGERILSCAAHTTKIDATLEKAAETWSSDKAYYREESGTSMAAPHVAGAVAAFLSIQPEFTGRPEAIKSVMMKSCTDLGRKRDFQGAGLIDLMRMVQSV